MKTQRRSFLRKISTASVGLSLFLTIVKTSALGCEGHIPPIDRISIQSVSATDIVKTDVQKDHTKWFNSLSPRGQLGSELILSKEGKSDYTIILSNKPTTQDLKAAEELQKWLEQMTGATLSIVSESKQTKKETKIISIGHTQLLKNSGLRSMTVDLSNEGYGIDEKDGVLFLWGGKTRGVINAVFALLEEDLGCRWYSKECTIIPKSKILKFAPVKRTYVPLLKLRDPFWYCAFNVEWSLRNRTNAPKVEVPEQWGGRMDYNKLFVHTFGQLLPKDEYFEKHPEYYMLNGNNERNAHQLCTTNPDVIRIVKKKIRENLKENPKTELISVSKNDGGGTCQCPNCKAVDDAEGSKMSSLLLLVNAVAEDIEKDYPNVLISTLAYGETGKVPKTIRPRKNVAIRLCSDKVGAWWRPFETADICDIGTMVKRWSEVCTHLYIWDYNINFSHYLAPMPNMDVMADNIRFYANHNTQGVMLQASYQTEGTERDCLRSWVAAKLLWDPFLNLYDLMDDFIFGYFGEAAQPIAEYNRLLQRQKEIYKIELSGKWLLDHKYKPIRYGMDHPFLSKEFLFYSTELYDQAEELAENEQVLERVQRDRLPISYVKLMRGPDFVGDEYGKELDLFEKTVALVGLTHLHEGNSTHLEEQIKKWRKQWNEYIIEKEKDRSKPTVYPWGKLAE